MVLDAYREFSPRMADLARRFFDEGWIDAPVRPGKAPGAFAHPTTPSSHPYVLVNYLGKPRDVTTLAHELGHGVHQVLAGVNGALMAPTPLTLAETASVFGEMLTFRSMLAATTDPAERKSMLAAKVEDMLNTVVRQIAFYKFERLVHLERRNGELTPERIGQLWMSVQAESLGPAIELGDGYETYWAYIGHFIHSPFYVYAYAFGDCLVNSLYGVYERSREGFAERYLAMLSAGGSKSYSELIAPFGLDAQRPGVLEHRPFGDRAHDRRTRGSAGLTGRDRGEGLSTAIGIGPHGGADAKARRLFRPFRKAFRTLPSSGRRFQRASKSFQKISVHFPEMRLVNDLWADAAKKIAGRVGRRGARRRGKRGLRLGDGRRATAAEFPVGSSAADPMDAAPASGASLPLSLALAECVNRATSVESPPGPRPESGARRSHARASDSGRGGRSP